MATRRSPAPDSGKPPPKPRRTAGRQAAAVPQQPGEAQGEAKDEGTSLWTAGLKALDSVRQDAARRHASVIESLLGIVPAARRGCDDDPEAARGVFPSLDTFGLRKFEDVFDQRVAGALERLGMPTRDELLALRAQLDEVLAQLQRLGAAPPASPPAKKTPAARRTPRKAAD